MNLNKNLAPRIEKVDGIATLLVNDEPFIILGGEVHNSSGSNLEYMNNEVWPNLRGMNINTVLIPIYWECLEPQENQFDYTLVDGIIKSARLEGVKVVFLWFGLWKNSESMYVPQWIKQDQKKYFLTRKFNGEPLNTISPLCQVAVEKDAYAFQKLMQYIKEIDSEEHTVIMVQVENEIGILGSERDYGQYAQEVFEKKIPENVAKEFEVDGNWQEAFGENAGEYFSAYYFAKAVEYISQAGKEVYKLPLYANAWLEQFPWRAGSYPSGGPVMKMKKMWKLVAPSISFLAPDIYVSYVPQVMDEYSSSDNALFVPEVRKDAVAATYALYAVGGCHAIGFCPFGIEDLQMEPDKVEKIPMEVLMALNIDPSAFDIEGSAKYLAKAYDIIKQIQPLYYLHRGTDQLQAFVRKNSVELGTILSFGEYDLQINYSRKERYQPEAGGFVIQVSENEFYMIGTKYRFEFLPKLGVNKKVGYLTVEEGHFCQGKWCCEKVLNGDERMRIELKDMPKIIKVKTYQYD